jgi:hypothetical protein
MKLWLRCPGKFKHTNVGELGKEVNYICVIFRVIIDQMLFRTLLINIVQPRCPTGHMLDPSKSQWKESHS